MRVFQFLCFLVLNCCRSAFAIAPLIAEVAVELRPVPFFKNADESTLGSPEIGVIVTVLANLELKLNLAEFSEASSIVRYIGDSIAGITDNGKAFTMGIISQVNPSASGRWASLPVLHSVGPMKVVDLNMSGIYQSSAKIDAEGLIIDSANSNSLPEKPAYVLIEELKGGSIAKYKNFTSVMFHESPLTMTILPTVCPVDERGNGFESLARLDERKFLVGCEGGVQQTVGGKNVHLNTALLVELTPTGGILTQKKLNIVSRHGLQMVEMRIVGDRVFTLWRKYWTSDGRLHIALDWFDRKSLKDLQVPIEPRPIFFLEKTKHEIDNFESMIVTQDDEACKTQIRGAATSDCFRILLMSDENGKAYQKTLLQEFGIELPKMSSSAVDDNKKDAPVVHGTTSTPELVFVGVLAFIVLAIGACVWFKCRAKPVKV